MLRVSEKTSRLMNSVVPVTLALWLAAPVAAFAQETRLYWGDTHLHTSYSPDAYLMQNRTADPDTAYRYAKGVPMGGDLTEAPSGKAPTFLIQAVRDPRSAPLDRLQVIKGWLDADGLPQEKVYTVAVSKGRSIAADGSVDPVGNTVDIATGDWTGNIGSAELAVTWTDPDFDAGKTAFYYARVLEIPTPRHTLADALALGVDPKETGNPATIQERAYSSPIWYTP